MEKKTKGKKQLVILLVACVAFLITVGTIIGIVVSSNRTADVSSIHTVVVKDQQGNPVEEVCLSLYGPDDKEVTWLPYVTNITGEVKFTQDIGEGYYVKVAGVPMGYKLDDSVQYSFEGDKMVIVLGEDDSAYVAQIGDQKFFSFSSAVGVANGSNDDVTIELLADITINTATLKNSYSKTITIDGGGHMVTTAGGNNVFLVNQNEGVVEFKNMNIKHTNTGSVLQVGGLATINVADVKIDATEGTAYNYALINTMAVDGTTTLNFTRVDVKMAVGSPAKAEEAGIIRTGNTGGTKNVEINLVDCNFDTTDATGRQCIVVMKNTVATINATNTTFKSGDSYAIWAREQSKPQTLTMTNCVATATGEKTASAPIEGYFAQIGNTYYLPLSEAFRIANESSSNTTVKLFKDITIKTCDINNKKGKLVTLDGCGKTVTTSGGNNAFVVGNNVMFKNMTINHKNTGSAIHITTAGNISASNVTIKATEGKTYSYSLINALATGEKKTTIDLNRVNVVWAVESKGDANASVIRTGNASVKDSSGKVTTDNSKFVDIKLTNCNFDTTKATGRTGITVTADSTTTVDLKNTTIKTMDTFAVRSNKQTIIWENADTTLTSLTKTYQDYPVEYYLAKIGEKFYTLEGAAKVANAANGNTQIDLMASYTIGSITLKNTAGKQITLNGNNKTITTSGKSNAFLVGNKVALKDMTIKHKETGSAIQITDVGTIDVSNVTINATEGSAYDWALVNVALSDDGAKEKAAAGEVTTLNMTNVKVTMSVAGRGKGDNAIIRTGNEDKKNVNINLTGCDFNTEKATGRSGIIVMKETNATINVTNTTMKTLDVPAVVLKDTTNHQTMTVNSSTFDSVSAECKAQPIKGYDAMVGNVAHKAITMAIASVEPGGTVELLQNVSCGWVNVEKSCTIDGNGYKITTTKGNSSDKYLFVIKTKATEVTIKDMDIVHRRCGMVVRYDIPGTLTMNDVNIDATQAEVSNEHTLFDLKGKNGTTNLVMNNVNVDMDATDAALDSNGAIIRTGSADAKDVNITLKNCKLDAAGAVGRSGIVVINKTNANISLENTKIKTKNVPAIKANEGSDGQATLPESADLICGKKSEEHQGYTVKLGDTWYVKSNDTLWDDIKNATEDVALTLTTDTTLDLNGFKNKNGNTITINVAGSRLETTGTPDASVTINSEAAVTVGSKTVYLDVANVTGEVANATGDVTVEVNIDCIMDLSALASDKNVAIDSNNNTITTTGEKPANVTISSQVSCVSGAQTYYATFENAAKKARQANVPSTITLSGNVSVSKNIEISNTNGKAVTIDGAGKTITTSKENALTVMDEESVVTVKNVKLKHTTTQGTLYVGASATLNVQNVDIEVTKTDYQYGLISLFGDKVNGGSHMVLNMENVDIDMSGVKVKSGKSPNHAIIRTGNNGAAYAKTVEINMTDCNLNAASSSEVHGIMIMNTTTATVTMNGTNISTKDVAPIYNGSTTSTVERTGGTFACTDGAVKIGTDLSNDVFYATLKDALAAAKTKTAATTVEICSDIAETNIWEDTTGTGLYVTVENSNGKKITVDGNWCSVTIGTKAKNALRVKSAAEFKEMTMNYSGEQCLVRTEESITATTLDFTNVDINASTTTGGSYLQYGIINILTKSGTSTLNLNNTDIKVTAPNLTGGDTCVIRGGNAGHSKSVKINMTNSTIDATASKGRIGIWMPNVANAEVVMTDSKITVDKTTYDKCAAMYGAGTDNSIVRTLTLNGTSEVKVLTSGDPLVKGDALYRTTLTDNTVANASIETEAVESAKPETKEIIIDVPTNLYDKFVEWIKDFGTIWGWNTGL